MSQFIKNIEHSKVQKLADLVEYADGQVSSLTLAQQPGVGMTVFAFAKDEGVSTHAAPGDAFVYIIDGEAQITIDGVIHTAKTGESLVMPANIPHAVKALTNFKMLLTVVK